MTARIYVGNLSFGIDSEQLTQQFHPHGTVQEATVVMDRDTGQSKGFGFVEMSTSEEAQKAIQALDGTDLDGRAMRVNEAKPREDRGGGGGNGPRSW